MAKRSAVRGMIVSQSGNNSDSSIGINGSRHENGPFQEKNHHPAGEWVFVKFGRDQKTKDNERLDYAHAGCMCVHVYVHQVHLLTCNWTILCAFAVIITLRNCCETLLLSNGVTSDVFCHHRA